MRLSDESISKEREVRLRDYASNIRVGPDVVSVSKEALAMASDDLAALIAEVRALRECEKALEVSNARCERNLGVDGIDSAEIENKMHFAERSGARPWRQTREILAARAALAGVRALEDKP